MTTEVGVPGKSIQYLNLHQEGVNEDSFCKVDEQWTGPIITRQSDYLVAISRFEVPMNRMPITREIDNAVEIFRYYDQELVDDMNRIDDDGGKNLPDSTVTLPRSRNAIINTKKKCVL